MLDRGPMSSHDLKLPQIVYIAGYGRSGSTVLDVLLGNHPQIFGAGELSQLFFYQVAGSTACSCGQTYRECGFWKEIMSQVGRTVDASEYRTADQLTKQSERLGVLRKLDPRYRRIWRDVFGAIMDVTNREFVVDSSKSARVVQRRMLLLRDKCNLKIKVIHLVRDPRAVMWSLLRGATNRQPGEPGRRARRGHDGFRTLLSWILTNTIVESQRLKLDTCDYLRVRYEDLLNNPEFELRRIGRLLGLDMASLLTSVQVDESFNVGHGVSGNRLRRRGPLRLTEDKEWHTALPTTARLLSYLAWPLARRYGYSLKS